MVRRQAQTVVALHDAAVGSAQSPVPPVATTIARGPTTGHALPVASSNHGSAWQGIISDQGTGLGWHARQQYRPPPWGQNTHARSTTNPGPDCTAGQSALLMHTFSP